MAGEACTSSFVSCFSILMIAVTVTQQLFVDTDAGRLYLDVYPTHHQLRRCRGLHLDSGRHKIRVYKEIRHAAA